MPVLSPVGWKVVGGAAGCDVEPPLEGPRRVGRAGAGWASRVRPRLPEVIWPPVARPAAPARAGTPPPLIWLAAPDGSRSLVDRVRD